MNTANIVVAPAGYLVTGRGAIGEDVRFTNLQEEQTFAQKLAEYTLQLTHPNTGNCIDEREILRLADGTTDSRILSERVTNQVVGGPGLATAKAAAAAKAGFVGDADNFTQTYYYASRQLADIGIEDGGHDNCGASNSVKSSVEYGPSAEVLLPGVQLILDEEVPLEVVERILENQKALLAGKFYDNWNPEEHVRYLEQKFPQNLAYLNVDHHHKNHGHRGRGIHFIREQGFGFATNAFAKATNEQAFGVTVPFIQRLSYVLGGSDEERRDLRVAFAVDHLQVGSGLVASNFPIFEQKLPLVEVQQ